MLTAYYCEYVGIDEFGDHTTDCGWGVADTLEDAVKTAVPKVGHVFYESWEEVESTDDATKFILLERAHL